MSFDELFEQRCLAASKLKECIRNKGCTKVSFAKKVKKQYDLLLDIIDLTCCAG